MTLPSSGQGSPAVGVKLALWIVCLLVAFWFLTSIVHTLVLFGAALGMSLALAPLVRRATGWRVPGLQRHLSWGAAVGVVYLLVTFVFVVSLVAAVPVVVEQARSIATDIPNEMPRLQAVADDYQTRFARSKLPPRLKQNLESYMHQGIDKLGAGLERAFELTASGLVIAFSWVVIFLGAYLISIFLMLDWPGLTERFFKAIPEPYRTDVRLLIAEMNHIFGGFVRGMGVLALTVGAVNFILLNVLGMLAAAGVTGLQPFQYSLLVSVLSAVGYLVPMLGVAVTSLVAGLLAWFQYPDLTYVLVVVLILFVGSNAVDRIVGPKVMSKAMGVSPLFVMFAAFAGAELCGFWGMILGVPAAAMLKALWIYLYQRILTAEVLPAIERPEAGGTPVAEPPPSLPEAQPVSETVPH